MTKEYTTEDIRDMFLKNIANMVQYWEELVPDNVSNENILKYKLRGLTHSILVSLDGGSIAVPGFIVAPIVHPDDKQYHIDEGDEGYFPENHQIEDQIKGDIGGSLHDSIHKYFKD